MKGLFETVSSFITLGGPVVAILAIVSVLSLALILMKFWQFCYCRAGNAHGARHLLARLRSGRIPPQEMPSSQQRSAASGAVLLAFRLRQRGDLSRQDVEDEVSQYSTRRLHDLQSGFRLLDAIAQLAPLLGLFGTVIGMIEAFQQLQGAGSNIDPSLLAGGIWVALLTTAAGLAVAMPVSLVLTVFETRVENERINIETLVGDVLSPVRERPAEETVSNVVPHWRPSHAH